MKADESPKNVGFFKKLMKMLGFYKEEDKTGNNQQITQINSNKDMWVPDDKALTCLYGCGKEFSALFLRKHHCRICGNVFCKDCCSKVVEGTYWGSKKPIKVCDYCFDNFKKLDESLVKTFINPDNINIIEDIESVNDNILSIKRETKFAEYCNKSKEQYDESFKFLNFDNKKYEDNVLKNLDSYSESLIRNFIEVILKRENLYDKWFKKIYELTRHTISNVNPSFKDLNDKLDINEYVKIKTILYKDNSLTAYIDGYTFEKNVYSKKMQTHIENPKILLLDCGLEYYRNSEKFSQEQTFTQLPAYFNIIIKKIELVNPNVILVNKGVSRKIQEALTDKITLVMNVKSRDLKRIARMTQTLLLPSTDLIDSRSVLGNCKEFKVEKIKNYSQVNNNNNNDKQGNLKNNEYNLMMFKGCNPNLGCTLILSGPDQAELKTLKKILNIILLTARDIYLQKHILYFSNYTLPYNIELYQDYDEESKTRKNSDYGCIMKKKSIHHLSKFELENIPYINDFDNGFDTSILNEEHRKMQFVKLTITQGHCQFNLNDKNLVNPSDKAGYTNNSFTMHDFVETDILKKINGVCREPQEIDLKFFSDEEKEDKAIGKLILDLCAEKDTRCDYCKKNKSSHIYYVNRKTGRLKVQMLLNQEDHLDKILEFINKDSDYITMFNNFSNEEEKDNKISKYIYLNPYLLY